MNKVKRLRLDDVIAERKLDARRGRGSHEVTVRLGRPVKPPRAADYRCPYQVMGINDDVVRSASGEDSIQALQLAMKMIGADLHFRYKGYKFTWLGQRDIGFPGPKS